MPIEDNASKSKDLELRIEGYINMPKDLEYICTNLKPTTDEKDSKKIEYINLGYLESLPRKIDAVLLCVFYGIYKSQELPPDIDPDEFLESQKSILNSTYRFTVRIDKTANLIRHILFILWISQVETQISNTIEYRKKLYGFLQKILDSRYFLKVIIPFYLCKAAEELEGEPSFIIKLKKSADIKYDESIYAPEYIALEFNRVKIKFEEELSKKLEEWKKKSILK